MFSAVRAFHNCGTPKERRDYIWPDRKMQVCIYLTALVLLPYVLNPHSEAAWLLMKSYFPCTYYFYCGSLIFCFFGTVKQLKMWKPSSLIAGIITFLTMIPFILHAWLPSGFLSPEAIRICSVVAFVASMMMVVYCGLWGLPDGICPSHVVFAHHSYPIPLACLHHGFARCNGLDVYSAVCL